MTLSEIERAILAVKKAAENNNNEEAHVLEDTVCWDFIEYVAERSDFLGERARKLLTLCDIDFEHYYGKDNLYE